MVKANCTPSLSSCRRALLLRTADAFTAITCAVDMRAGVTAATTVLKAASAARVNACGEVRPVSAMATCA
jgi:hypothetical protein